jgi:hypothetical protein
LCSRGCRKKLIRVAVHGRLHSHHCMTFCRVGEPPKPAQFTTNKKPRSRRCACALV